MAYLTYTFKQLLNISISQNVSDHDSKKSKRVVKSYIRNFITHTTVE
jgi:hypothetical protein